MQGSNRFLKFRFGTWSIRVLNDPLEQKELKALIIGNKLWFCGVLEAKLR